MQKLLFPENSYHSYLKIRIKITRILKELLKKYKIIIQLKIITKRLINNVIISFLIQIKYLLFYVLSSFYENVIKKNDLYCVRIHRNK